MESSKGFFRGSDGGWGTAPTFFGTSGLDPFSLSKKLLMVLLCVFFDVSLPCLKLIICRENQAS